MKTLLLSLTIIYSTMLFSQNSFENEFRKRDSIVQLNIGKPFPVFKATTLENKIVSEDQLLGKVTIINFWFQYCEPCVAEFNELNSLNKTFKDNPEFQFLSFTSDSNVESNESVKKYKLDFNVCPVTDKECYRLNFNQGFPTTIIVDQAGKIVLIKSGGSLEKEKVASTIQEYKSIIERLLKRSL